MVREAASPELPHICFVLPGIARQPGGGHKVVYQYANGLEERGCRVSVMHIRPAERRSSIRHRLAYRVLKRQRPHWFPLSPAVAVSNYSSQVAARMPDADIFVATSVKTASFVNSLAQERKARGMYLIQHYEDFSDPADVVEATWRLPLERVVVSGWLLEMMQERGLEATLIRNGVDTKSFRPGPPVSLRRPSVLALVARESWKRTDLVIDVATRIHQHRSDVEFRTFGTVPRPVGLPSYVQHLRCPSQRALTDLYREAAVFICTSDFEGFGLPAVEAMACGTPVVSTRNGGVEDFAAECAVFTPRGDGSALAHATLDLLSSPDRLSCAATRGLRASNRMELSRSMDALFNLCASPAS